MSIVFDIETCPLQLDYLQSICPPFDAEQEIPHPGEFDPASVKTGTMKDPEKIKAKIEDARAKHTEQVASVEQRRIAAAEQHFAKFCERAALSAITGRVLCIAYYSIDKNAFKYSEATDPAKEPEIIEAFWKLYAKTAASVATDPRSLIGVNIKNFDLPFLIRRSMILGIDFPENVITNGRYWSPLFVDLCEIWLCGERFGSTPANFDALASAFGTNGKPDGVNGAMFFDLWNADRDAAIAYMQNDVMQPATWAKRMGVVA